MKSAGGWLIFIGALLIPDRIGGNLPAGVGAILLGVALITISEIMWMRRYPGVKAEPKEDDAQK